MKKSAKLNSIFTGLCSLKMDMKETFSWISWFRMPLSVKPNLRKGLGSSKIPFNCSPSSVWFSLSYTVSCYIKLYQLYDSVQCFLPKCTFITSALKLNNLVFGECRGWRRKAKGQKQEVPLESADYWWISAVAALQLCGSSFAQGCVCLRQALKCRFWSEDL